VLCLFSRVCVSVNFSDIFLPCPGLIVKSTGGSGSYAGIPYPTGTVTLLKASTTFLNFSEYHRYHIFVVVKCRECAIAIVLLSSLVKINGVP